MSLKLIQAACDVTPELPGRDRKANHRGYPHPVDSAAGVTPPTHLGPRSMGSIGAQVKLGKKGRNPGCPSVRTRDLLWLVPPVAKPAAAARRRSAGAARQPRL